VPEAEDFHHSVYVILLDPAVIGHPSIQRLLIWLGFPARDRFCEETGSDSPA
jgi:hypothetical protein